MSQAEKVAWNLERWKRIWGDYFFPPRFLRRMASRSALLGRSGFGGKAARHAVLVRIAARRRGLGQEPPLRQSPERRGDEVDAQPGGHLEEHQAHQEHDVLHDLLLLGRLLVGRRRHHHLLLDQEQHERDDGEQVQVGAQTGHRSEQGDPGEADSVVHGIRHEPAPVEEHVRRGQVGTPADGVRDQGRVAQLHVDLQGAIKAEEDRHLDEQQQAAAEADCSCASPKAPAGPCGPLRDPS